MWTFLSREILELSQLCFTFSAHRQKGKDTEEGRNPQFLKPIMMLELEGKLQLMQVCQVLWVCYYASLLFPRVT